MTRLIAVLRPEPGNRVTAAAIESHGLRALRLPLFEVRPLAWDLPDPAAFDALILTSANAVRHAGPGLASLFGLPVHAVGEATAEAARGAGFGVETIGCDGAAALLAAVAAKGVARALHLGGRERTVEAGGIVAAVRAVYASEPLRIAPQDATLLAGSVALVQSARAGRRLAALADEHGLDRGGIAVVAVSEAAARAAGAGWQTLVVARDPTSDALIDAARALAD